MQSIVARISLAFVLIASSLVSANAYSSRYGGNCDRGLRGPPSPCDGYGPGRGFVRGGPVQMHAHTFTQSYGVRVRAFYIPGRCTNTSWVIRNGVKIVLSVTSC
jgi:hypothetical protein